LVTVPTSAAGWAIEEFDPRWPAFAADPYAFYARLRKEDPVHFVPVVGMWWATRYAEVLQILKGGPFGKTLPPGLPAPAQPELPPQYARLREIPPNMLNHDPPDHTRLRGLVNKAFTPRVLERLRPHIAAITDQLLDEAEARGRTDLVADLAFPLPAIVIAELLGVPSADRDRFKQWSNAVIRGIDASLPPEARADSMPANLALVEYFEALVRERRGDHREDLISDLIAAEEQGDRLSAGELISMCTLLLIAGHETTTNLIGNGMLTLLRRPEKARQLRENPNLLPAAVEELLRYESPVQRMGYFAQADVELGGRLIKKGMRVLAVLGAANRDPAVFTDPEELILDREPNRHLAFGQGPHYCLGAPLARLEAQIAFGIVLHRFPNIELDDPGPVWHPNTLIRGLKSLPVRV
jgi:pimeloyl-[acyl-carrier protein] synthase